jgi:hypothetical protein
MRVFVHSDPGRSVYQHASVLGSVNHLRYFQPNDTGVLLVPAHRRDLFFAQARPRGDGTRS